MSSVDSILQGVSTTHTNSHTLAMGRTVGVLIQSSARKIITSQMRLLQNTLIKLILSFSAIFVGDG